MTLLKHCRHFHLVTETRFVIHQFKVKKATGVPRVTLLPEFSCKSDDMPELGLSMLHPLSLSANVSPTVTFRTDTLTLGPLQSHVEGFSRDSTEDPNTK